MPQPQIAQDHRALLEVRIHGRPDLAAGVELVLGNHGLAQLGVVVEVGVLGAEPQLRGAVLGPAVDEARVEGNGKGVLRVLEAQVRVDVLPLLGC